MSDITSDYDRASSNKFRLILPSDFRGASVLLINNKEEDFISCINKRNVGDLRIIEDIDMTEGKYRFDYVYMQTSGSAIKKQILSIKKIIKFCVFKFYIIISKTDTGPPDFIEKIYSYIYKLNLFDKPDQPAPSYHQHLNNELSQRFSIVKSIDYLPLLNSSSSCLVFEMRKLEDILVISGPSGVGKSYFLEKLANGTHFNDHFPAISLNEYKFLTSAELKVSEGLDLERVLLHYNITRSLDLDYFTYENEPAEIIERASNRIVYVLACPVNVLISRVRSRVNGKPFWSRRRRIANSLISQYSQQGMLKQLYVNWINYCKKKGAKILYIDVGSSDNFRVVSEKKALDIVD